MKKILLLSIMMVAMCGTATARSVDDVFNAFSKDSNAELISVPNLKEVTQASGDKEIAAATSNIEMVKVLTVENATEKQLQRARKLIAKGVKGMEELLNVNEKDEDMTILAARDGEKIVQMLIFALEKDEVDIILLKGDLNMDDIKKVGLFN